MSCLYEGFAKIWINIIEYLISDNTQKSTVNDCLTRSNALQDLERTGTELELMEKQIIDRIKEVSTCAKQRALAHDKNGALKKLHERRVLDKQLEKLRGNISSNHEIIPNSDWGCLQV